MYHNESLVNSLKLIKRIAKEKDPKFNVDNYIYVLGIKIFDEIISELILTKTSYKLFGIKVFIDYNNSKYYGLFKEVI